MRNERTTSDSQTQDMMIWAILRAILVRFGQARHCHCQRYQPAIPENADEYRWKVGDAPAMVPVWPDARNTLFRAASVRHCLAPRRQIRCCSRRTMAARGLGAARFSGAGTAPQRNTTGKRGGPRAPMQAGLLLSHQKVYLIRGDAPIRYIPDFFFTARGGAVGIIGVDTDDSEKQRGTRGTRGT